jgi:hypothetical protein
MGGARRELAGERDSKLKESERGVIEAKNEISTYKSKFYGRQFDEAFAL